MSGNSKCLTPSVCSLQNNEVVASLVDLFRQFEVREEKQVAGHHAVVDPTPLREALSNLPDNRFKVGERHGFTRPCWVHLLCWDGCFRYLLRSSLAI